MQIKSATLTSTFGQNHIGMGIVEERYEYSLEVVLGKSELKNKNKGFSCYLRHVQ